MLKILVTLIVVSAIAVEAMPVHDQVNTKRTAHQSQQNASQPATPTIAPVTSDQATIYQQESKDTLEGWHKFVTWPEGITAWLIMLTLGAIIW